MSEELEIRAAKALGCTDSPDTERIFIRNVKPIQDLIGARLVSLRRNEFKFTTSYDWAMLGVRECESVYDIEDITGNHLAYCSPEQITQAWVEVLEAQ